MLRLLSCCWPRPRSADSGSSSREYDIDEIKTSGEKGPMKACIVTCMGRSVEFTGAEGPSEASRLLNVFRLVAGHGSTPKD